MRTGITPPAPRIAVGSILTESNHFAGSLTHIDAFERYQLERGPAVLKIDQGYVGGMLDLLVGQGAQVAPLLVASACPGGPISAECYRALKTELLNDLASALPLDGVALALHGAAAAEGVDDVDGDILRSVRELVGPAVPIVASLDLHANVTLEMIRQADALVALETYPHRDAQNTGRRAARMLLDIVGGRIQPKMVMAKVPVLTSAVNGGTEDEGPFAELLRFAKTHEGKNDILSVSVFLVHPYLDTLNMGSGGLVIANGDQQKAESLAISIAHQYWEQRFALEPKLFLPTEAIIEGMKLEGGPILLVETADCSGGGAAGDSVASLRALLELNPSRLSLVPVVDPEAALLCHQAGLGQTIELFLGHKLDPQWGKPIAVRGKIIRLSDGLFRYSGGPWANTLGQMGRSAVLQVGPVQVLVTSWPTYDWANEQYQSMDMDARTAQFVVVKNPMNHREGYKGIARAAFILDTPGPTPATLRNTRFQHVARPYYPADPYIADIVPDILSKL